VSTKKNYAVLINENAANLLGIIIKPWVRKSDVGTYFLAKSVDTSGPYLHMVVSGAAPGIKATGDFDLQIPHVAVLAILASADVKRLGFV
jgi:hypothetical protein